MNKDYYKAIYLLKIDINFNSYRIFIHIIQACWLL